MTRSCCCATFRSSRIANIIMAPIIGKASIAYLPRDRVVGISKLARVLHGFARRLQVQERLTAQVADCICEHLQPKGVAVVIEASHACMTARGRRHAGRDDDHQPDDGDVQERRAQPARSAGADGLLSRVLPDVPRRHDAIWRVAGARSADRMTASNRGVSRCVCCPVLRRSLPC